MRGVFEFSFKRLRVFGGDASDENVLLFFRQLRGDGDNLPRSFTCAKNDFRKTFAECAMRIHLGETKVGHRRSLKSAQYFITRNRSTAKFLQ